MNQSQVNDPRFWQKWKRAGALSTYRQAEDRQIAEWRKTSDVQAVVRKIDGQLVLDDPAAAGMFQAVAKHNCQSTLNLNAERVEHFKRRLAERGMTADQAVIVLLNVDDVHGGPLADVLMPGADWQQYRDRGEVPFARGLAGREGIQEALDAFDKDASTRLKGMSDVAVVVVDHGVAEVFTA